MHIFFELLVLFIKLLMRVSMFFTREKTNYLSVPDHVISYLSKERICRIAHILPSLIFSIIIGVKILPDYWPAYAKELDENGGIISLAIFLIFIPVAIINGVIIEKILNRVNSKYQAFKIMLEESNDYN